jgi:hypothetical protein
VIITYDHIRDTIQSGDVMLCKSSAPVSMAIRVLTGESWNHVALCVWIEYGLWIAEMREGSGYRLVPASEWMMEQTGQVWLGIAPHMDREDILPYVLHTRSRMPKYGWRTLLRVWWSTVRNRRIAGREPVCSTFAQNAWEEAGYSDFTRLASPGIISEHCRGLFRLR